MELMIFSLYGGCFVEELIYGKEKVLIGVLNDIECVIEIVCKMVI